MTANHSNIDINESVPVQEPERQRYFMAKCRELVQRRERELGRKLTFHDQTFGCQMILKIQRS